MLCWSYAALKSRYGKVHDFYLSKHLPKMVGNSARADAQRELVDEYKYMKPLCKSMQDRLADFRSRSVSYTVKIVSNVPGVSVNAHVFTDAACKICFNVCLSFAPDGRAVYSGMCTCGLPAVMEALCEHALSVLSTPVVNASVSLVCLPIHGGAASNVHPPSLHLIQVFSIESLTAARFLTPNVRQMLLTVGPLLSPATSDFWDRVEAETPEGVLLSPVWYTSPVAKNKEVPV